MRGPAPPGTGARTLTSTKAGGEWGTCRLDGPHGRQRVVLHVLARQARVDGKQDLHQVLGEGARAQDGGLCTPDFCCGHQLHGVRDLLRALHAADAVPQVLQGRGHLGARGGQAASGRAGVCCCTGLYSQSSRPTASRAAGPWHRPAQARCLGKARSGQTQICLQPAAPAPAAGRQVRLEPQAPSMKAPSGAAAAPYTPGALEAAAVRTSTAAGAQLRRTLPRSSATESPLAGSLLPMKLLAHTGA